MAKLAFSVSPDRLSHVIRGYLISGVILSAAYLVSAELRLSVPIGETLGADYNANHPLFYALAVLGLLVTYLLSLTPVWAGARNGWLAPERTFRVLALSIVVIDVLAVVILPQVSLLQVAYFTLAALAIGGAVVVVPGRLWRSYAQFDLRVYLGRLYESRHLVLLWFRYNIKSRYSQTLLGILWIVVLPISTSAVLAFAFSNFLRVESDAPFFALFLAALVPYHLFSNGTLNGMQAIAQKMSLINQIYFPREILVLVKIMETLVDFGVTFLVMVGVNLLLGIFPTLDYLLLVIPLAILVALTLGLSLITSCLSIMIRDIPQLVTVILQLMFYASPVLYSLDNVRPQFKLLVSINPLAHLLEAFRGVIVYHRPLALAPLIYPFVVAVVLLYVGYAFFKRVEKNLADYV